MSTIHLRPGHVQAVWAGHPWVFAQAIANVDGAPSVGDVVAVRDPEGKFIGQGFWSPKSAIPVRILSRRPDETLDSAFLARRIENAATFRKSVLQLPNDASTGYRMVHSEGDGLPGLIVDVYDDVVAVELLTAGMKRREDDVIAAVARAAGARSVIEVARPRSQELEGIDAKTRVVRGPDVDALRFKERDFTFEVPLELAQKTGFYFDQRENRAYVEHLASNRRVLDVFSYIGAFALAAARGGASEVVALDSSAPAIALGATLALRHGMDNRIRFVRADARRALGAMAQEGERFDVVIVDPPKLVPTSRHLERGMRAYRSLNKNAIALVGKQGIFVSCSCSAAVKTSDFLRTIEQAVRDAGRSATLLHLGQQGADHPVPLSFPEGRYLKCAILRLD